MRCVKTRYRCRLAQVAHRWLSGKVRTLYIASRLTGQLFVHKSGSQLLHSREADSVVLEPRTSRLQIKCAVHYTTMPNWHGGATLPNSQMWDRRQTPTPLRVRRPYAVYYILSSDRSTPLQSAHCLSIDVLRRHCAWWQTILRQWSGHWLWCGQRHDSSCATFTFAKQSGVGWQLRSTTYRVQNVKNWWRDFARFFWILLVLNNCTGVLKTVNHVGLFSVCVWWDSI